ncbi:MAG: hypothetical protein AAFY71_24345 [Bacteroidota bacterium]
MSLEILKPEITLNTGDFFEEAFEKNSIYLHHTAGRADPNTSIDWWNNPGSGTGISTPFLIGGIAVNDGDSTHDGIVYRAYDEDFWSFHLGVRRTPRLEKSAIAIEICNAGYLEETEDGFFSPALKQIIGDEFVIELDIPFRDHVFYHKYTEAQIEALRLLLIDLGDRYEIDLAEGLQDWIQREENVMPNDLSVLEQQKWLNERNYVGRNGKPLVEDNLLGAQTRWAIMTVGQEAFEYNVLALNGASGIWSHTNVRSREIDSLFEKSDCSPQPLLKEMILSL